MSIIQNQNSRFWKDVLSSLRRIPSIRDEIVLSKRDNETVSHAILLNAQILLDSCSRSTTRTLSNLKRWCVHTKRLDIKVLDRMMKEILLLLRKGERMTYDDFKRHLSFDMSDIGAFVAPIKDILVSFLKRPCARDFRTLNQFLSFMTRITLLDVDFQAEELRKYYSTEEKLKSFSYDFTLLDELRTILVEWLGDFKLSPIIPQHGPGGVAFQTNPTAYTKYNAMRFDSRLDYLIKADPCASHFIPNKVYGETRTAEVVFVPKSLSSMRVICMEPASLMYYQQGIWKQLDRYMSRHRVLRNHIRLHDQTHNRRLSMLGSLNQTYATIDLSAASDSVSWELVKHVFRGTDYYKAALLTRSTHASLPDGNTIALHKFAPMGSTLCFPTQCLVFSAICEYVARKNGVRGREVYAVYGDDIVIYESLATQVAETLEKCGFTLNREKSYLTGRFKESCGGEYFDGIDVTPLKLPRKYKGTLLTHREPSLYKNLIDFTNSCNRFGFKHARSFLINRFESLPVTLRPLFDDGRKGIFSPTPTNFDSPKRILHGLQSSFVVHGDSRSPIPQMRTEDEVSYQMWHIQASMRQDSKYAFKVPEDTIVVRTAPSRAILRSVRAYDPCGSEDFAYQLTLKCLSERNG